VHYDLLIRNVTIASDPSAARKCIAASDEKIVAIESEIAGSAAVEFDGTGLLAFPGHIDPHVHFNEPGRADWEGFGTGSAALAAGGGTCYFDMPLNSSPPTCDGAAFDAKRAVAERKSHVDFGLWGGLVPGNLDRLDEMAARGAVGFKAFMCDSGLDEFPPVDDATLFDGMVRAAKLGRVVAVHAENQSLTREWGRRALAGGRTTMRDFLRSRPVLAELEAIRRAIQLAAEARCALHIVHVSTGRGAAIVAEARTCGIDVTCETCPHYLRLTEEDAERLGSVAKCAPPLRSAGEQNGLWQALKNGEIEFIASDHSPSPPELKAVSDLFAVWGGVAGCQTTLGVFLTDPRARTLHVAAVQSLICSGAARRFRVPHKGHIQSGDDADIVLMRQSDPVELRAEHLFYRHPLSPYMGLPVHELVHATFLRGRTVYADGKVTSPPFGRFIRPAAD
jgi:allantoinase